MPKFPPNKYQTEIIDWVKNGTGNALIDAKAGSGKTSTLELIAQNYDRKMLFLAFNNHIAAEINQKPELQPYLTKKEEGGKGTLKVMTVNSLGNMTVLNDLAARKLYTFGKENKFLDDNKLFRILRKIIEDYCRTRHERVTEDMIWDMQRDLRKACDKVRCKYISGDRDYVERIIEEDGLCKFNLTEREDGLSYPYLPWASICEEAIDKSLEMYTERGSYDFIEQLYIPVVNKLLLPNWMSWYSEFIGVDEAQDLSQLQLTFIKKLIPMQTPYRPKLPTRFLFVADRRQAIYAFAGADCHSVENIKKQFNTTDMGLNICYRCAKNIIEVAQQEVPDIEAAPNAIDGEVHIIDNEEIAKLIKPKGMAIARKNKDLAEIFLSIVLEGKPVYIKDKELVENTIKSIRSLGCSTLNGLTNKLDDLQKDFKKQMSNPENSKSASAINNGNMDIFDTVKALLDFYIKEKGHSLNTPIEIFIEFIKELLVTEPSDNAAIVSSIHQVKGLEADEVFIINYNLMPYTSKTKSADENMQERNLKYIAVTRARKVLYLCNGELDEDEKKYYNQMTEEEIEQTRVVFEDDFDDEDYI